MAIHHSIYSSLLAFGCLASLGASSACSSAEDAAGGGAGVTGLGGVLTVGDGGGAAVTPSGGGSAAGGSAGGGSGATGTGGGAATPHGHVDFVAYYRAGSAWDGNAAAQTAVEELFADYENNLRTGGDFDATIEVCFDDQSADGAYGYVEFANDAPPPLVSFRGGMLHATSAWAEIVLGLADPNGAPNANQSKGCDFYLQYNFSLSQPQANKGLIRHECIHGLGADVGVDFAQMDASNKLTFPAAGTVAFPTVHDLNIVDKLGRHLVEYDSSLGQYVIGPIQFNATFAAWTDPMTASAGTYFSGVADDGTALLMENEDRPCGVNACDFFNEMPLLMKVGGANTHPTWDTLDYPDRAWLRAMGYTVAADLM